MKNRKWLTIYSIFLLTVVGLTIFDFLVGVYSNNGGDDVSFEQILITSYICVTGYVAIIGVIGRATILYFRHQGKNIEISMVHLASFGTIFILPIVVQIFIYLIFFIIHIPKLLPALIKHITEILSPILSG